jgi:hypothetical protein
MESREEQPAFPREPGFGFGAKTIARVAQIRNEEIRQRRKSELEVAAVRVLRGSIRGSALWENACGQLKQLGWSEVAIKAARGEAL